MEEERITVDKQQCVSDDNKDAVNPSTASPNGVVPEGSCHDSGTELGLNGIKAVSCEPLLPTDDFVSSTKYTVDHAISQEASDAPPGGADAVVGPPTDVSPSSDGVGTKQPMQSSCDVTASTTSAPISQGSEAKVDENLDELVSLGDNVIVERSPGGRYVRFMEKLGSGASKDVYRAYDTQEGIEVAWNAVNIQGLPKTDRNRIVNEVRLLEQLHHQNIISFHGSWVNRERQEVIFVTEILSSGTLKSFIKKVQVIRWKIAKRWAVQILNGLEYLHSRDPPVIHRDLKCENIFINGASGDLRIGDFGLSTLYRNGKVRSVLGTPEFMAPDMYEETSYDEKVDIYAFGMCLLEIFTKEIPYAECSNPAQIYKKVSSGKPPEVLSRLRSRHAREFVELCLGHQDETTGKYIRPTASELLKHSFLEKRASDDDEVEVEPPLREKGIVEEGESQSISPQVSEVRSPAHSDCGKITTETSNCKSQPSSGAANSEKGSIATSHFREQSIGSFDDDDDDDECDRFEQMPESEINIRNVKVFMGRGQELKVDEPVAVPDPQTGYKLEIGGQQSTTSPLTTSCTSMASNTTEMGTNGLSPHFSQFPLVTGTAAPGDMSTQSTEIRQFVVTFPLKGQTQNVQFDFHLVNDDPVQVANEMVSELGLPQDVAVSIAAIIKNLASEARDRSRTTNPLAVPGDHQSLQSAQQIPGQVLGQTMNGSMVSVSGLATVLPQVLFQPKSGASERFGSNTSIGVHRPQAVLMDSSIVTYPPMQPPVTTHLVQGQVSGSIAVPTYVAHVPVPGRVQNPLANSTAPGVDAQFSIPAVDGQGQSSSLPPRGFDQAQSHGTSIPVLGPNIPQATQSQHPPVITVPPSVGPPLPLPRSAIQSKEPTPLTTTAPYPQSMTAVPTPLQTQALMPSQHVQPLLLPTIQPGCVDLQGNVDASAFQRTSSSNQLTSMPLAEASFAPVKANQHYQHVLQSPLSGPHHRYPCLTPVGPSTGLSPMIHSLHGNATNISYEPSSLIQPTQPSPLVSPLTVPSDIDATQAAVAPILGAPSVQNTPVPASNVYYATHQINTPHASSIGIESEFDEFLTEDESMMSDELRKLQEDYQKNLMRTKKVFDSRMDNLQRTLVEREVQHLRSLEKHEKDRAAFERRVQQEELEHTRRIEQLQREWDEKREHLAREKQHGGLRSRKPSADGMSLSPASGGVRSHSTSPIHHPELLGAAAPTAAITPLSLENMPNRPPLSRDSSAPKLD